MPAIVPQTTFTIGSTTVHILQGDVLAPGVPIEAVASPDDDHFTMAQGVARRLADCAGRDYVAAAQAHCPVAVTTVVPTDPFALPAQGLLVKQVLHAAVIDYGNSGLTLEQAVYQSTNNCLALAELLGLKSILLPAFGTGAGGLEMAACAAEMCGAIKVYLAQRRQMRDVYIILYLPAGQANGADKIARNDAYILAANLILGVPYDPATTINQCWDLFGHGAELDRLAAVAGGQVAGKRHGAVRGGPNIGVRALLEQLSNRLADQGLRAARAFFGNARERTGSSFIYRKLLLCLQDDENDPAVLARMKAAYAEPDLDRDRFLAFLDTLPAQYANLVYFINDMPTLLAMDADDFFADLDLLAARVRFAFSAHNDEQYAAMLAKAAPGFRDALDEITLRCVDSAGREAWVDALYTRYLGRTTVDAERRFFAAEAGRHPYLIALAGNALVRAIKTDALTNPERHPAAYNSSTLAPFFRAALGVVEAPRRAFFERLMMGSEIGRDAAFELRSLAGAVAGEAQLPALVALAAAGDDAARIQLVAFQQTSPRLALHADRLAWLDAHGYIAGADPNTAQFMAAPFAAWVTDYFGLNPGGAADMPKDVQITLVSPKAGVVLSLFRGRGITTVRTDRELPSTLRSQGLKRFGELLNWMLHPEANAAPGELDGAQFQSLADAGLYIRTRFAAGAVNHYIEQAPTDATITLEIDGALQIVPWELMLQQEGGGEVPFRVGRRVIGEPVQFGKPVVRGDDQIKALLIGNPTGDLADAADEVRDLADALSHDPRFAPPDVRIGAAACRVDTLQTLLSKGAYGLVHYSGHSRSAGEKSAWQLPDGDLTGLMLRDALRMGPPAFVFSSSCESGIGSKARPIKYENQTFDLPGAFIGAGVEAYIGTLWQVEAARTRQFVQAFYQGFLAGDQPLGECLRVAKTACRQLGDKVNWASFLLYGDPRLKPAELYPAMKKG